MNFSPEEKKLNCKDESDGTQSLRHIKLSATYFSKQQIQQLDPERVDGPSLNLSQNSGEKTDFRVQDCRDQ